MQRRVVVTGLGAITPLGVGIRRSWQRLLDGESGIASVAHFEPQSKWSALTSTVAGVVPTTVEETGHEAGLWRASDWMSASEERRMSKFAQFAVAASEMAMKDAGWRPTSQSDLEATGVCLGSGIGNLDEMYNTSLAYEKEVNPSIHDCRATSINSCLRRDTKRCRRTLCQRSSSIWPQAI